MNTEEDDEFKRIEMESGWRKRQIEQSEMCSNYGGFCKKKWVGLTDEEIEELRLKTFDAIATNYEVYRAIESILKEKNT